MSWSGQPPPEKATCGWTCSILPKSWNARCRDKYVIVAPGKCRTTGELISGITDSDPEVRMPPVKANRTLSKDQIEILTRWVKQGAPWGKHWAFEKPVQEDPPKVADEKWCRNPIDRFVLARLEKQGIQPSVEASRETLLRRISLDLTGLPPMPEELDAFCK